jgi:toxin CptA
MPTLQTPSSIAPSTMPASAAPLLAVCLKPSMRLAVILGMAHVAAIGLLWPLMVPPGIKLGGSALLAASLVLYWRHHIARRSRRSILGFELTEDMNCILETKEGNIACSILGSSFVAPYLAVLELKPLDLLPEGGKDGSAAATGRWWNWWKKRRKLFPRSLVILPDAIDAEAFRQLRVLLRWKWKEPV